MRVTGVDACRRGWVAVSLETSGLAPARAGPVRPGPVRVGPVRVGTVRVGTVRAGTALAIVLEGAGPGVVGIDMPLGLLESGWREADRVARRLLGRRGSSVFAIPPRAVWAEAGYPAANQRCRELTGQGCSIQAWGLQAKLLEANHYRDTCGHPLYEVHPELAFSALAGTPLADSKHTASGRELRRELLARAGIVIPAGRSGVAQATRPAPVTDILDAAAVAWSAWRIATGQAVIIPDRPQHDRAGREIAIRY